MTETEGAFRLTFVEGRGLLSLTGRDFEHLGHVERLELEIPNLRFPFDMSGGVGRFKNRRLRLRELALSVAGADLTAFLARAPLADFGIFEPWIAIEGRRLTFRARVALGGREVEVTAVAAISALPPRGVSLCIYDVRAYGFLPIPAPLVVTALFSALGAEVPVNRHSSPEHTPSPLVHLHGPSDVHIDVCDLVMLAILPMHGWRMPERRQIQVRVAGGGDHATRLPLLFTPVDPVAPSDAFSGDDVVAEVHQMRDFARRCASVEAALAIGDMAVALTQLRALVPLDADDRTATTRLLQLLLAGTSTLAEAGDLAQAALARWSEFVPGLLALAVLAAERDQADEAAELFERVAQLSAEQGREEDESCALVAAARQWAAAGQTEQALAVLERGLSYRGYLDAGVRTRIMKKVGEGRWPELLTIMAEEARVAQPDVRDEVAQVLELARKGARGHDDTTVAQAAGMLEVLLAREQWPDASLSRAEAAYQLGCLRLSLGDDQAALHWFGLTIEGDAPGTIAAAAWQALVEILRRRGDDAGVAQALAGWAGDGRTSEVASERVRHLLEAAQLTLADSSSVADAAPFLERALSVAPVNPSVLAALEHLGEVSGRWLDVIAILRHHLGDIRPEDGKPVLRLLSRLLVEKTDQRAAAREVCRVLHDLSPDDEEPLFYLAHLAWDGGDRKGAQLGYQKSAAAKTLSSPKLAEANLRLAQLAFANGRKDDAERYLEEGLLFEPEGARVAVLIEALREIGRDSRLPALLTEREAGLSEGSERQQIRRVLATAAEHDGDLVKAEAIYRSLLDASPDDIEVLDRLASLCKRQSHDDEQLRWLDKLWAKIESAEPGKGPVDPVSVGTELASLLARDPAGLSRAEAILRRVVDIVPARPAGPSAPSASAVLDALHGVLVERGAFDEAGKVFLRRLAATPEQGISSLLLARARLYLDRPDGLRPVLALLQTVPTQKLGSEVLTLRGDVAERVGDLTDALRCWQQIRLSAKDDQGQGASPTQRLVGLALRPETDRNVAIDMLEKLRVQEPDNVAVVKALFDSYGRLDDVALRNRAWQDLLTSVPTLPDSYWARLQIALAEVAESEGDLRLAEELLRKAESFDQSPTARAAQLLVQARLLVAHGEIAQAQEELATSLAFNPNFAEALALLGDLAYQAQEWDQARTYYERLALVPNASASLFTATLAYRRGELAEMFGDHAEAEAAYRQVVTLDPQNCGAREALAGFALQRGDLAEAALHLQEVVRLLPKESVDELTQARQRLGQVYLNLGDLVSARQNLELALASDPDRPATLEMTTTTYQRLGLHREAAAMCERLSRILADPVKKAEALFHKGEILRGSLADVEGANDAYLRASDLDPSFAPTLARLASYSWAKADLGSLADIGADLVRASPIPKVDQDDVGLLVAIAVLLTSNDEELAKDALASPTLGGPLRPDLVASRLGELASRVARGSIDSLDAVLACLFAASRPDFEVELRSAALAGVMNDPGDAGRAMVLARLLERSGQPAVARAAYSLAHFIDSGIAADKRLAELGEETVPRPEALAPGSAVHLLCRGPLRRILHHLATAFATVGGGAAMYQASGEALLPPTAAICDDLRAKLGTARIPTIAHGDGGDVTFSATQPLTIMIGRKAESLAPAELRFFVARALEQARAGTLAVLRMSQGNLSGMLRALLCVAGATEPPITETAEGASDESTTALWIDRLRKPELAALIPWEKAKDELVENATSALTNPPELESYIRGCRYTADRVGLLACGSPLAALRALAGLLKVDSAASGEEATLARRQEQLRASPALRELVAFMFSDEYSALVHGR
jgi:tetratricopeptide (TPR) repeat protein